MYNVLLVDDEFMILTGLKKLIPWKDLGLRLVGTAQNGKEALELVENKEVDIVLSDITMPILSGIEFLRKANNDNLKIKTIFLSGYQEFAYVKEGMSLGAVDYLLKPVNEEELVDTLKKTILILIQEKEEQNRINQMDSYLFFESLEHEVTETFIEYYKLKNISGFSVFIVENPSDRLLSFIKTHHQILSFIRGYQLVGIVYGMNQSEIKEIYQSLVTLFPKFVFFEGTHKESVYDLTDCFKEAEDRLNCAKFYHKEKKVSLEKLECRLEKHRERENPLKMLKDYYIEDVSQGVSEIINYFKRVYWAPEKVKQVTLNFTLNTQRFFNLWQESEFQFEMNKVHEIMNISELESYYYQLLSAIERCQEGDKYSHLTKSTIKIIRSRYHEELRLKDIADELFVNAMYLGQVIKKETGKTFSQYFNDYRMKKAEELLVTTQKNINEIAFEVGYTSAGYFNKMFKEVYQLTPKEYREVNVNYE